MFLGAPFNIASYSLLVHIICKVTGLEPGRLIWVAGDVHVYKNHEEQVLKQLVRNPREFPKITVENRDKIEDFVMSDFHLEGYNPHPAIKAEVAV